MPDSQSAATIKAGPIRIVWSLHMGMERASTTTGIRLLQRAALVSVVVHALALTALAYVTLPALASRQWIETRHDPFAGERIVLEVRMALPSTEILPLPDLPPVESPLLVTPDAARVQQRLFIDKTTAEVMHEPPSRRPMELAALAEPPRPVALENNPAASAKPTPPVPQASTTLARTPREIEPRQASTAAVPQVAGTSQRTPPKLHNNRPPRYPDIARRNRWEGTVLLKLFIDAAGQVTRVEVARSSGYPILDAEAVSAVRIWRGEPARQDGKPVATEELLPVRFRLE